MQLPARFRLLLRRATLEVAYPCGEPILRAMGAANVTTQNEKGTNKYNFPLGGASDPSSHQVGASGRSLLEAHQNEFSNAEHQKTEYVPEHSNVEKHD